MDPLNLKEKFQGLKIEDLLVLDVGCGRYNTPISNQMRQLPFKYLASVDIHAPIVRQLEAETRKAKFAAAEHYIGVRDAAEINVYLEHHYDVIMFLDVIEHLPKNDAMRVLIDARRIAKKRVLVWLPLNDAPQGALEGNPNQVHQASWTVEELEALGYKVSVFKEFHKQFDPPVDAAWAIYSVPAKPKHNIEAPQPSEPSLLTD